MNESLIAKNIMLKRLLEYLDEFDRKLETTYDAHERWLEIAKLGTDNKEELATNMMSDMFVDFIEIVELNIDI
jgi:hypothetical protein